MEDQTRQFVFVVSVVDRDGKRTSRKVSAASGRDALAAIESEGYTDAELLAEESMAVGGEAVINAEGVDVDAVFSPDEQLAFAQRSRWGNFAFIAWKLYRENLWLVGVAIALPTWEWWRGPVDGQISRSSLALAGIVLFLPLAFAARANLFGSAVNFDRMLDSLTWGRWRQVLRLTPQLRGQVRDLELDAYEAHALAGLGQLQDALARLDPYREDPSVETWYLCSKYAEVYDTVEDEEALLDTHRRALESAPETPVVVLDAALAMLRLNRDVDEAARLVARVRDEPLGGPLDAMLSFVEGLLSHRRGDIGSALTKYLEGQHAARAWDSQPMVRAIRDEFRARGAIAYAEAGDAGRAMALWRQAEPRIRAGGSSRLLSEVEAALSTRRGD